MEEFEVFTAVVMKSIIFWDMTPCSPLSSLPPTCSLNYSSTLKMEAIRSSDTLYMEESGSYPLEILARYLPGGTEENHRKKPQL
jgi:hypothetical protein